MLTFRHKTRGNSSPQGKERVYFAAHPDDHGLYYEEITEDILKHQNCAVYSDPEPREACDLQELRFALESIQLMVIPITARFLYQENRARCVEFPYALEKHIPVLPLMYEPGLEEEFNRICGDLQFLDKFNTRFNPIPYTEKLQRFLNSVLLGDELAAQVRQAFDAYIFLSYRKKDRVYAQELMKLIHKNDFCRDIAIWYDEYLTPGESFHEAIAQAMEKSKLFAMAVTPNLVNEDNYVMTVEYPEAAKAGKIILPLEMEKTSREALLEHYRDIPQAVDAYDAQALTQALKRNLKTAAIAENDEDPQHLFFIGLAYLSGIDVEKDGGKAVSLLTASAEKGFPEAMEKLIAMYTDGEGVPFDLVNAVDLAERLMEMYGGREKLDTQEALKAANLLASTYYASGKIREAYQLGETVLEKCRSILGEEHAETGRAMANAALACSRLGLVKRGIQLSEQHLQLNISVLGEEHLETLRAANHLVSDYREAGRVQEALALSKKTAKQCEELLGVQDVDTVCALGELALCYAEVGEFQKAVELGEKMQQLSVELWGETHLCSQWCISNLTRIYQIAEKFTKQ